MTPPSSLRLLASAALLAFAAAALPACRPTPSGDGAASSPPHRPAGEGEADGVAASITAADLAPAIHLVGTSEGLPEAVVIELAQPIATESQVGGAPAPGTELSVDPPVDGGLVLTSPSTLRFVPAGPLRPDADYVVTLGAVATPHATLTAPPGDAAWRLAFRTPPFRAVRAEWRSVETEERQGTLDLVFAGPVAASTVEEALSVRRGGAPLLVRVQPTESASVLRLVLPARGRAGGALPLVVEVAAGVPLLGAEDAKAPAARFEVPIPPGPAMEILAVRLLEGPSGFYVDVVCTDAAAPAGWNGFWDETTSTWYDLSTRCVPDDASAAASIQLDPPAGKVRVSPTRSGFRVLADFARGGTTVTFLAGLTTRDGGVHPGRREVSLSVPARAPQVRIAAQGRYLPSSAFGALPVRTMNVSELAVQVRHVPERNVVHWLTADSERADNTTSDLVAKATIPVRGPADAFGATTVDLSALVPVRAAGVYEIQVASGAASARARILVTDLQLVAKRAAAPPDAPFGPAIDVWAVDAHSLAPAPGTEVDARRRSGTVLARCTTDARGHCRLAPDPKALDPEPPFVLVARRGADLTYLRFDDLETPLSESDVAGEPYLSPEAYRVAPYTDRGVYRPGETARFAAIVRGTDRKAPPPGMPVLLQLVDPRGRVVERTTLSTSPVGLLAHDVAFGDWAPTGRWEVRLSAGDKQLAAHGLHVEEFVPERMEVGVRFAGVDALPGEVPSAQIDARYLFGGSAEGSEVELSCELEPADFTPEGLGGYRFGPWRAEDDARRAMSLGAANGALDAAGRATLSCPPIADALDGPARVVARGVVFEAGSGRSTQTTASIRVHPSARYVGLQTGTEEAKGGQPLTVSGVVVDWASKPAQGSAQVELRTYRLEDEFGWWYDEDEGSGSYRRSLRKVEEGSATVSVAGGRFTHTVTPESDAAGYLVEATLDGGVTGLHVPGSGTSWWWDQPEESVDVTPKPLRPGTLALTTPERLRVGVEAQATFTAPYAGRALVTVETHEVVSWEWLDVRPGPVAVPVRVDTFTPNVYVSALLLRDPHLDGAAFLPDRSFGVASVRVDAEQHTQALTLTAPAEVRPNTDLVLGIDAPNADDEAVVTVAAVDEGILQLTKFASPDPLADLLARRALGVRSYETVGWSILLPPEGASSATGGDGDGGGGGRAQPVEPVALWSGVVPIARGKATVTLPVPSYRGKLRVMAVAVGRTRVGRAEASVLVREPLVLQATLPRFLVEGDVVAVPAFVTNTTAEPQTVVVRWGVEDADAGVGGGEGPALLLDGPAEQRLTLAPGASGTAVFEATAKRLVGAARVTLTASAGPHTSRTQAVVPFQPDGPRRRTLHRVPLAAGTTDLSSYLAGWLPTTERTTVRVTRSPYGEVFDHLSYLVRYPYGCLEQTTSGTRPMLFVQRLIEEVDPALVADAGIADRVNSGIRRVLSMQTGAGGFGYWPGDDDPSGWATAYATHMLLDAREVGYDVPERSLDDALRWMERQIDGGATEARSHYGEGMPYMHYVLARAGRGRKAQAAALVVRIEGMDGRGERLEDQYLLKAALWRAGDRRHEAALRAPDVTPVRGERANSWSFYSDRRRRGFVLSIFGELFGADPGGEQLAGLVAGSLAGESRGYTTQELVWGVTGLGRRLEAGASDFAPAVLTAGGKELKARPVQEPAQGAKPTSERAWDVARLSERGPVAISVPSKGEGALFALVASEGVPRDGVWERGGKGLSVRRTVTDLRGDPIDAKAVPLGQLVAVRLDLQNTTGERVQNVALVDRLPAGFEIENADLGRGYASDLVPAERAWAIEHRNVRDDRIELFGALERGANVSVVYQARATSAGDFVVPPVEAEAMYDPSLWAREVGDRVVVVAPWEALTEGGQ